MLFLIVLNILFSIGLFSFALILSKFFSLYDYPNDAKLHNSPVSYLGGITVMISSVILCSTIIDNINLNYIFFFSFVTSLVFILDDKYNLSQIYRLIITLFITLIFIYISNIFINDFTFLFLGNGIELNIFSALFTSICIILLINSNNYFDGIDGVAGSLYLIFLLNIFFIFYFNDIILFEYLILCLPIIIFLFFNFNNKFKMFLGNNGSASLGFSVATLIIYCSQNFNLFFPAPFVIWVVAIFFYEFLSINLSRIKRNINIFQGGRDHLHYILFNKFKSKIITILYIICLNQVFFIFGVYLNNFNDFISYFLFIVVFFIYFFIREKFIS